MPDITSRNRSYDYDEVRSTSLRTRNYTLNKDKALKKKLKACDRDHVEIEDRGGNYYVSIQTAAFEVARKCLVEMLHMPKNGEGRHLEYEPRYDNKGRLTDEVIKIKNWMAVSRMNLKKNTPNIGPCNIVINTRL